MDEFKDIEGFEGKYQISNNGKVRNNRGHILMPYKTKKGYQKVDLWKNHKKKVCYIHRLVAEAFIPNPKSLPQVNHMDGNKKNNTVENLEWCTAKENTKHSIDTYLRTKVKAVDMFSVHGDFIRTFPNTAIAEKETGIAKSHIWGCCKGKYGYKTAGGYVWKFHEGGVQNVIYP